MPFPSNNRVSSVMSCGSYSIYLGNSVKVPGLFLGIRISILGIQYIHMHAKLGYSGSSLIQPLQVTQYSISSLNVY